MKVKEEIIFAFLGLLLVVNMVALYTLASMVIRYNTVHEALSVEQQKNTELSEELMVRASKNQARQAHSYV